MESETAIDNPKQRRQQLADDYLKQDLSGQRDWYDRRAAQHKKYANRLGLTVIACGALTTFMAALKSIGWPTLDTLSDVCVALLGVSVALVQGTLRIWRFDETWIEYRLASERILRERRLFINAVGPYAAIENEGASLRHFIEAVEQIIAEEQKIYFKQDWTEEPSESAPPAAAS